MIDTSGVTSKLGLAVLAGMGSCDPAERRRWCESLAWQIDGLSEGEGPVLSQVIAEILIGETDQAARSSELFVLGDLSSSDLLPDAARDLVRRLDPLELDERDREYYEEIMDPED